MGAWFRKLKRRRDRAELTVEAHYVDSFSVLRNPACGVHHLREDPVIQLLQRVLNHGPRAAGIVRLEILHVFQKQHGGTLLFDDTRQIEEQCSLRSAPEAMLASETFLL